ncbi:Protein of unknown function [Bacillus mycoides]|nr:Protein of unknown function [Bacillus mycoides]
MPRLRAGEVVRFMHCYATLIIVNI